jgi:hypothetical protein
MPQMTRRTFTRTAVGIGAVAVASGMALLFTQRNGKTSAVEKEPDPSQRNEQSAATLLLMQQTLIMMQRK